MLNLRVLKLLEIGSFWLLFNINETEGVVLWTSCSTLANLVVVVDVPAAV